MIKNPVSAEEIAEIAPYEGQAYVDAIQRLLKSSIIQEILPSFFPNTEIDALMEMGAGIKTVDEFHATIILIAIKSLLNRTSDGLTISGDEKLRKDQRYLIISNHRDIVADAALLSFSLVLKGGRSLKICLGDNLLFNQWATDMVKVNKGVIVKRNLPARELLRWSHVLSHYLAREIREGRDSVWIAQREGRTKDGMDKTQPGVLRMLALSGEGEPLDRLQSLNIRPAAISYEYEPCGGFKVRETMLKLRDGKFTKTPEDDRKSMAAGMLGRKGRIHIGIGEDMSAALEEARAMAARPEQLKHLARAMDRQIISLYRLWPTNYAAHDMLSGSKRWAGHYSPEQADGLLEQMRSDFQSAGIPEDDSARTLYLQMYAAPVSAKEPLTGDN